MEYGSVWFWSSTTQDSCSEEVMFFCNFSKSVMVDGEEER